MEISPGSRPSHGTFPERFPAKSRMPPRITITTPRPKNNLPSSRMPSMPPISEGELALGRLGDGRGVAEVRVGSRRRPARARAPPHAAELRQEGLADVAERLGRGVAGRGGGLEADGTAPLLPDDGDEEAPVATIAAGGVDPLALQRVARRRRRHHPVA